jgi:hypothetical protein
MLSAKPPYMDNYYEHTPCELFLELDDDLDNVLDFEKDLRSKLSAIAGTLQKSEADVGDVPENRLTRHDTWQCLTRELDTLSATMLSAVANMLALDGEISKLCRDCGLPHIVGPSAPSIPVASTADKDVQQVFEIEHELRSMLTSVADTLQKDNGELGDLCADGHKLKHIWQHLTAELPTRSATMRTTTDMMMTLKHQIDALSA